MPLLSKIPGKHYFISIFVIGTILFSIFSAVIYRHYEEAHNLNLRTSHDYEVVRQSRLLLFNLLNMETGVRGYLLTGRKQFLEPYYGGLISIPQDIGSLRALAHAENGQQAPLNAWLAQISDFQALLASEVENYDKTGIESFFLPHMEQQKKQMDALRQTVENSINQRMTRLLALENAVQSKQENFRYILILGTVLAIGAMLLATLIIIALIARAQRAMQATTEAEERFRLVMNGINDGVYDFNPQNESIYYSPAFKSMLSYSDEEFPNILKSFNDILHPDDREATWDTFRRYERRELPDYRNIFRLRHKDGSWRWILSRGVGFWNERGEMIRLIGTHMDITEQKKREEDLAQANGDLETFTYIASHDLRSPLVNLKGFAKELARAVEELKPVIDGIKPSLPPEKQKILCESLDEDIPESLKFIEKSAERMDTLTTAVLDLSRIGKREYRSEPVDVAAIVHKCIGAQNYEIEQKKAEVICEPLPMVISDALALEQIFSNLLDNAVKYLEPSRQGQIVISARQTAMDTIFSVSDNGRGIAPEDQRKIFEMFRRARNTDDVRGAGMGMSFVKATLRKLGGSIWCESTLGSGTTFYIRLPR